MKLDINLKIKSLEKKVQSLESKLKLIPYDFEENHWEDRVELIVDIQVKKTMIEEYKSK